MSRDLNISNNLVIAALIGALGAVAAAFVTGAFTGHSVGLAPTPKVTVTVTQTPTTPATTERPPSKSTPSISHSSSPISILAPVNQPGWTLAWHGKRTIGPQGIRLASSGPQVANGDNYDLQYLPGSGWEINTGGYVGAISYWLNKYRPGPATINGILSGGNYQDPVGMEANVGDRICTGGNGGANGIGTIAYMQVIAVRAEGVVVDMWLWDSS